MAQNNSLDELYICHTVEHAKEIEILEQLKTHGLVDCSSRSEELSRWVLVAGSFSQLRIAQAMFSKQSTTNTKQHKTKKSNAQESSRHSNTTKGYESGPSTPHFQVDLVGGPSNENWDTTNTGFMQRMGASKMDVA